MTKDEFHERLIRATDLLIDFTATQVKNKISKNVYYRIVSNFPEKSDHLTAFELDKLEQLIALEKNLFTAQEVVDLLFENALVPLWINTEVYRSKRRKTIVILICSRRFREEKDLFHKADAYPPFHLLVPLPPWRKEGRKYDINWQHQKWKRNYYKWKYIIENNSKRR